jgi:DNA mismatch endonuclease, patch repair protein
VTYCSNMADSLTRDQRSKNMARIKSIHTRPEVAVRKYLFRKGLRFRIAPDLPGKPDIVLPRRKVAIFVHGCFWHRHGCKRTTSPKTNSDYWENKFKRNKLRDKNVEEQLRRGGWRCLKVWECDIAKKKETVIENLYQKIVKI